MHSTEIRSLIQELETFWPDMPWGRDGYRRLLANLLTPVAYADAVLAIDRYAMKHHRAPTLDDLAQVIDEVEHDQRMASAREALAANPEDFGRQYPANDMRREQDQRIARHALLMIDRILSGVITIEDAAQYCRDTAEDEPDLATYWHDYATQLLIGTHAQGDAHAAF